MHDLRSLVEHQTELLARSARLLAELEREMRSVTAASLSCRTLDRAAEFECEDRRHAVVSLQDVRFRISA